MHMVVRVPVISKTFNVELPLNQACNKKIAYMNPWDKPHVFLVRTSEPHTVKVKQPRIEIRPKSRAFIRLWFKEEKESVDRQVLLFINDQNDQNEECIRLKLTFDESS